MDKLEKSLQRAIANPNQALTEILERLERESPKRQAAELEESKARLATLKSTSGYERPIPDYKEDSIDFCIRAITELPDGADAKGALLAYGYELRAIWQLWLLSRRETVERFSVKKSIPPDNSPNYPVAVWKLDELPLIVWFRHAEGEWYGSGGKTWKRDYFDYWAILPNYQ